MKTQLASVMLLLAAPALATDARVDPHPGAVPRTNAEAARIAAVTAPTTDFTQAEPFEANPAGAATVRARTFSAPFANLSLDQRMEFELGNAMFEKLWVSSPSSTLASDGLGPLFNARSCRSCHIANGRGHPPEDAADSLTSMIVRLSVPGGAEARDHTGTRPEPTYGRQLQDRSIAGIPAEGRFAIRYDEVTVALSEGEEATLRRPTYTLTNLAYGAAHPDTMLSPRVAQQMTGLGLLDAIPAADILAGADPDDADGDGISGCGQIVVSQASGAPMLGRFGHKAGQPTLRAQVAAAFHGDIGISSTIFPEGHGDCTAAQTRCRNAPDGATDHHDNAEIGDTALDLTTFYAATIAVPARREAGNPEVLHGKRVFHETGCIACHTPKFVTHRLPDQPERSFQLIWPYTDLLLHDMGPGLADHRPEGRANGREWRTPPLWGIGTALRVSDEARFLHDGRARTLLEAILWHGGEAEAQRTLVTQMPKTDRDALIRFLESL